MHPRARLGTALWLAVIVATALVAQANDDVSLTDEQLFGKRLFEDTSLSEPKGQACASCHVPEHAFQGNNGSRIRALARGSRPETFGVRNTPTIMYMAYSPSFGFYKETENGETKIEAKGGQFWDGRAATLVDQPVVPLLNTFEMNNPSIEAVVAKVEVGPYADLAKKLYGEDIFADPKSAMAKLSHALAVYESSPRFAPFSSKFDEFLRGKAKLTDEEMTGFRLFKDKRKGNCLACHVGNKDSNDPTDWIFTDFTYDSLGVPRNPAIPANTNPAFYDLGLLQATGACLHTA
jgi:cytochrome c peroxidase